MPNPGTYWETLLYGLAGVSSGTPAQRRDRILAALREVGFDPHGAAALDDAALAAMPPHRLVIVASDGSDDDVTFCVLPEAELDAGAIDALDLLDGWAVDAGGDDVDPARWAAWQDIALSTTARSRSWFEDIGGTVPENADAIVDRWAAYAFGPGRHNRLDGARFDRNFTRATFVLERV
jgi:hypothetical protein